MINNRFERHGEVWVGCSWHKCDEIVQHYQLSSLIRSGLKDKNKDWRAYTVGEDPIRSVAFCSFPCQEAWRVTYFERTGNYLENVEWRDDIGSILTDGYIYRTAHRQPVNGAFPLLDKNGKPKNLFQR